ncbi:MAG: hypothetical protein P4M14_01785 [Gammaproteobacteria bacterium]|nr:hypothetical protein [Gammaproteobacteria bacterium]
MKSRTAVLLLDIDDMLTNYNDSTDTNIVWNGSQALWQQYLTLLVATLKKANVDLYIGIATFKKKYINSQNEKLGLMGDIVSAVVLEDDIYIKYPVKCMGLGPNLGLKNLIDPRLVFFTGHQCKTLHALNKARDVFDSYSSSSAASVSSSSSGSQDSISKKNIIIMDDDEEVCRKALESGYHSVCVGNLSKLTWQSQKSRIANKFIELFTHLELEPPQEIIEQANVLEVVAGSLSSVFTQLRVNKAPSKISINPDSGIKGLDEDSPRASL